MKGNTYTTQNCGEVVVIEYESAKRVTVQFKNTGHVLTTSKRALTTSTRPCLRDPLAPTVFGKGCIGVGEHTAHKSGADTPTFRIWRAMLMRCYYAPENKPWREGLTVCAQWLNFQTFATWYEAQHPRDGQRYQLDKDLRVSGNKIYGPTACALVTQQQNLAARRSPGRGRDPRGCLGTAERLGGVPF